MRNLLHHLVWLRKLLNKCVASQIDLALEFLPRRYSLPWDDEAPVASLRLDMGQGLPAQAAEEEGKASERAQTSLVIHHPTHALVDLDEWVQTQHQASGLLEEVRRSTLTLAKAEAAALDLVAAYCPPRACPLAGSSVCFDRRFLMRHMPKARRTPKLPPDRRELPQRTRQAVVPRQGTPQRLGAKHRALPDILESIEELRYYRKTVFIPPPDRFNCHWARSRQDPGRGPSGPSSREEGLPGGGCRPRKRVT